MMNPATKKALGAMVRDPWVAVGLAVIAAYVGTALLSMLGLLPVDYVTRLGPSYSPPDARFWFGTDFLGRDVLARTLHGAEVAVKVGFAASLIAIPFGATLGALAGYFGRRVDAAIVWFYSTIDSIPQILFMLSVSFVLGKGIGPICFAIGFSSWVGTCRLIRAEVMKHKEQDYVLATRALGASHARVIFRHILPNVFHLLIIDFSLRFIFAIKSEAVLSYLGVGVVGEPSWGVMISDAKEELLQGYWWQLAAATAAMFFLTLSLNMVGDALRDALDPKLRN